MKELTVKLKVGDEILVGRFRNVNATDQRLSLLTINGQPVIHTSKGKKNVLGFRVSKGVKTK